MAWPLKKRCTIFSSNKDKDVYRQLGAWLRNKEEYMFHSKKNIGVLSPFLLSYQDLHTKDKMR